MDSSQQRLNDPAAIADRAKSRGWIADQHVEDDKQRNLNKYDDTVKEKQDRVLNKYAIWRWDKSGRNTDFEQYKEFLLRKGAPFPPIHELKDFWRFYKDQSVGRLRDRPTAQTLKARAKEFKGGYMRMTENLLSDEDTKEINYWIKNVLPYEENSGVKDIVMPKYNYKPVDLDRHLDALYTRGDLGITHERTRFQFHLILLMFANSGARKGGLLTDGIKYKNIHLVLDRDDKGNRRFFFGLDQRTVKNNKDPENNKFGVTGREHKLLRYDAIFLLLLLAIADGALDREYFIQILKGNGDGPIEWNDAALDIPICRSVDRQGAVHETKSMSEFVFLAIFRKLFMAEYDYSRASMHMIRREIGKQLDERYTEVERSQHLTQADKTVFGQSYVAFVSSCDGFAAFMREKPDHAAVEYFQGVSQFWQPGLPTKLPAALRHEISMHPDIIKLQKTLEESNTSPSTERIAKNKLNAGRKRLERAALEEHRAKCFKQKRRQRLLHGNLHNACDDEDPLNDLIPEKGRIAQAMIGTSPGDDVKQPGLMRDALVLLTSCGSVYYRPQEAPKNEHCPYCSLAVKSLPPRKRSQHVHRCRRKSTAETLGVCWSDLKFCFFCMAFYTRDDWQNDCQNHLARLKHCCSITYRHTLLRPAFCILCKQAEELLPSERLQYWERDADAIRHIDEAHGWSWQCAECHFSCDGKQSGLYHLHDAHGYSIQNAKSIRTEASELAVEPTMRSLVVDCSVSNYANNFESVEAPVKSISFPSPGSNLYLQPPEDSFDTSHMVLDPQLLAASDTYSNTSVDGLFSETSRSDTVSFGGDGSDIESLDELMSKYVKFPPDATDEGLSLSSELPSTCNVVDLTGEDEDKSPPTVQSTSGRHRPGYCTSGDNKEILDYSVCPATSQLQLLPTEQRAEERVLTPKAYLSDCEESNTGNHANQTDSFLETGDNSSHEQHQGHTHQNPKHSVLIRLRSSSASANAGSNRSTDQSTSTTSPKAQDQPSKRILLKLHRQKRLQPSDDSETFRTEQPGRKRHKKDVYKVGRYLAIWGKVFLQWEDGTTGWEPKSNILDKDALAKFQAEYQGIDEGVDILDVRGPRARGYQFLVHWHGRPDNENRWVDEKYMKRERVEAMIRKASANSTGVVRKPARRTRRRRQE